MKSARLHLWQLLALLFICASAHLTSYSQSVPNDTTTVVNRLFPGKHYVCTEPYFTNTGQVAGICTVEQPKLGGPIRAATINLGSIPVGNGGSLTSVTVNIGVSGMLGNISAVTQGAIGLDFATAVGGTCTVGASYNAGDSCTVNVIFTPTAAGVRYGAIILQSSSGTAIGSSYLQGVGSGPQIEFLPGTESIVPKSGAVYPFGVAVDASGNIYIADTGNNRVLKETVSGASYTETTIATSTLSDRGGRSR